MDRFSTPDTLVGIGGGGNRVIKAFVKQDWLVQEAVDPDGKTAPFDAYFVDTAQKNSERSQFIEAADSFGQQVDRYADAYDAIVDPPSCTYIDLIEAPQFTSSNDLNSDTYARDIADTGNLNCWWLEIDGDGNILERDYDYEEGVARRRALSKALYYGAKDGTDPMEEILSNAERGGYTAIVASLGGGTGSGMFLDLAFEAKRRGQKPTLFAVLPRRKGSPREKANTFAALSELEYLSLVNANPFDNVILLPFDEAVDGRRFDEAAVYSLLAHRNLDTDDKDVFDESVNGGGPPAYSPFTLAVPTIQHFEAPELEKSQENFDAFVREYAERLDAEAELYNQLESYLERHRDDYGPGKDLWDGGTLGSGEVTELFRRVDRMKTLLDQRVLADLDIDKTASAIRSQVDTIEESLIVDAEPGTDDYKQAYIETVPDGLTGLSERITFEEGGDEERLVEVVSREMATVVRRRQLLRIKSAIDAEDDDAVRLQAALDTDNPGESQRQDVEAERRETEATLGRLDERLGDLHKIRGTAESFVDGSLDEWRDRVEDDVATLLAVRRNREEIESLLDELERGLGSIVRVVGNTPGDSQGQDLRFEGFGRLQDLLAEADIDDPAVDLLREGRVRESVSKLEAAAGHWAEAREGGGFLGLGGPDVDELRDEYNRAIGAVDAELIDAPKAKWRSSDEASGQPFDPELRSRPFTDLREALDRRESELIESIVDELERTVEEGPVDAAALLNRVGDAPELADFADPDVVDDVPAPFGDVPAELYTAVEETLERAAVDDHRQLLDRLTVETRDGETGPVRRVLEAGFVRQVSERLHEVDERKRDVKDERKQYEALEDLLEQGRSFQALTGDVDVTGISAYDDSDADRERPFKNTVSALDRGHLLEADDLADADLWSDGASTERQRIVGRFRQYAERLHGSEYDYPGLETNKINDLGRNMQSNRYMEHNVRTVYLSRLFDTSYGPSARIDEVYDVLSDYVDFPSDDQSYRATRVGAAGPWDATMVVFLGGVMLDNLRLVHRGTGGLKQGYDKQARKLGDSMLVRHVYGIDGVPRTDDEDDPIFDGVHEGAYTVRGEVLNLANDYDDIAVYLDRTETEVVDELLSRHNVTHFHSKADLGDCTRTEAPTGTESGTDGREVGSDGN